MDISALKKSSILMGMEIVTLQKIHLHDGMYMFSNNEIYSS